MAIKLSLHRVLASWEQFQSIFSYRGANTRQNPRLCPHLVPAAGRSRKSIVQHSMQLFFWAKDSLLCRDRATGIPCPPRIASTRITNKCLVIRAARQRKPPNFRHCHGVRRARLGPKLTATFGTFLRVEVAVIYGSMVPYTPPISNHNHLKNNLVPHLPEIHYFIELSKKLFCEQLPLLSRSIAESSPSAEV